MFNKIIQMNKEYYFAFRKMNYYQDWIKNFFMIIQIRKKLIIFNQLIIIMVNNHYHKFHYHINLYGI